MITVALVTDRTQADVAAHNTKGSYNYGDMNRVAQAVIQLSDQLIALSQDLRDLAEDRGAAWDELYDMPYDPAQMYVEPKIGWRRTDFPTRSAMEKYLGDIKLLTGAVGMDQSLPSTMWNLTYTGANAIERSLELASEAADEMARQRAARIDGAAESWNWSGMARAGTTGGIL